MSSTFMFRSSDPMTIERLHRIVGMSDPITKIDAKELHDELVKALKKIDQTELNYADNIRLDGINRYIALLRKTLS